MPLIFQREISFPRLASWQPYVFGLGVAGISLFMMGAGTLGVARRHWDITFADAPLHFEYPPAAFLMLALNGMAAILAALGGAHVHRHRGRARCSSASKARGQDCAAARAVRAAPVATYGSSEYAARFRAP